MQTVNIHAAKTHLSRLIDEVAAGKEIVIARAGKPVAKLVPTTATEPKPKRVLGLMAMPSSWRTWVIIARSALSPASVKNNRGNGPLASSCIRPRAISPFAIGDSVGLPASGPP